MSYQDAKNALSAALNQVFNLQVKFDNYQDNSYQECVLYVNLETIDIMQVNNGYGIYYITGALFVNTASECGYTSGILADRAVGFNKVDGLYFTNNEKSDPLMTTLNFMFYSKPIQLEPLTASDQIKNIDNTVTGAYK